MERFFSLFLAIVFSFGAQAENAPFERQAHDHTIYVLRGEPDALARFHQEVGSDWDGGVLLDANSDAESYRYWAFEWRTAPQSRAFIMSAVFQGLDLEFETYDDSLAFPEERRILDEVAMRCGFTLDPFVVLPSSEVSIKMPSDTPAESAGCLLNWVSNSEFQNRMAVGLVGAESAKDPSN